MKIGVIVSMYPRLSETFILNQITGLIDAGHDVSVIAGIDPQEKNVHRDFYEYNLKSISYWLPKNKIWRYLKAGLLLAFYLHKEIRLIKTLNVFEFGKEAASLRLFYCMIPCIREGPFDILYCHFGENGNVGAMLKKIGVPGKLAAVFHGSDLSARLNTLGNQYYTQLFKTADLLLPVSEYFRKRLVEIGAPAQKAIVHRIGIDTKKFRFQPRSIEPNQPLKVLTIARLVEKKGLEYSIHAVSNLMKKYPEKSIRYHIIGEGPFAGDVRKLIHDLKVEQSVFLLGGMEHEAVLDWMMRSHIYILASVTAANGDQEGIPVSLMEAMATGMPVLSTYHSGIPELITHGVNGYLAPEKDVESLTRALEQLMLQPESWPALGTAARKTIETNYSIENQITGLVRIFEGLKENNS